VLTGPVPGNGPSAVASRIEVSVMILAWERALYKVILVRVSYCGHSRHSPGGGQASFIAGWKSCGWHNPRWWGRRRHVHRARFVEDGIAAVILFLKVFCYQQAQLPRRNRRPIDEAGTVLGIGRVSEKSRLDLLKSSG